MSNLNCFTHLKNERINEYDDYKLNAKVNSDI